MTTNIESQLLKIIKESPEIISIPEITQKLKEIEITISLSSVMRNLTELTYSKQIKFIQKGTMKLYSWVN